MSIKTLSNVAFLLSLSLSFSSHGMERDLADLPVGTRWPIIRPQGPIKTPTKEHAEVAREESLALYRAGKYDDFFMYVRDTANFGRAHWLKDHIVWPLYGYYLLNVVSNTTKAEHKKSVITTAITILDEILEKKSPGYMAVRYNYMMRSALETWFLEPIQSWLKEPWLRQSWKDIPEGEKILFSAENLKQLQSSLFAACTLQAKLSEKSRDSVGSASDRSSESIASTPSPDREEESPAPVSTQQRSMDKLHQALSRW